MFATDLCKIWLEIFLHKIMALLVKFIFLTTFYCLYFNHQFLHIISQITGYVIWSTSSIKREILLKKIFLLWRNFSSKWRRRQKVLLLFNFICFFLSRRKLISTPRFINWPPLQRYFIPVLSQHFIFATKRLNDVSM